MTITTDAEYEAAMEQIAPFFSSPPQPGSEEAERFVTLLREVSAYEGAPEIDESEAAVTYEIGGIKCDLVGCSYEDQSVTVGQYPQWVNRPCPKCGSNLLTEADFNTVQIMIGLTDTINRAAPHLPEGEGRQEVEIMLDGSGIPKIVEIK